MAILTFIPGLSSATKRPGFYGRVVSPAGKISAASIPLVILLVGNKTSAGSMTADGTPVLITGADDADAFAGPGSELACMAYGIGGTGAQGGAAGGALAVSGAKIYLAAVTEASSSPAAATATVTIAGTWTTGGSLTYRLSGVPVTINVGASDSVTDVAVSIKNAVNANVRFPFTATNSAGVLTLTTKNQGLRQNWHSLFQDTTRKPAGLTSTLTGGSSMTGGGKHFTGGLGSDSPTALLASIVATQFDRIAVACGDNTLDTTNIALWKTQLNNQAAPSSVILEQLVMASNDTLTNAASIANTTLNDIRFQMLWALNIETHPSVIAATFASKRAVTEQVDPCASYDALSVADSLPGVAPQTQNADRATGAQQETALGEGVTPLVTMPDGTVRVARSITTHCLNGSTPDYRVLDTSGTTVPDFVLKDLQLIWETDFLPNNPRVSDNPAEELPTPPAGVAYPDLWNATVENELKNLAQGIGLPLGLPILDANQTLANPPVSNFDASGKFIVCAAPVVPAANQHIIGVAVLNVTSV